MDDGAIIQDLLAEVNLNPSPGDGPYPVPIPAGSNPNTPTWMTWGGTQPNEGVGGATAYKSSLTSRGRAAQQDGGRSTRTSCR